MSLYEHDNEKITEYVRVTMPSEKDIEDFLHRHPDLVERDMMIVGRQVETDSGVRIDLLGLDKDGNVVVIEVKKGDAPRDTVSQILDYAVWVNDIGYDELNGTYRRLVKNYNDRGYWWGVEQPPDDLYAAVKDRFGSVPQPFNPEQRLYVVGEGIDEKTDGMCAYLRQNGLKIWCVSVGFFGDNGDDKDIQKRIRAVHTDASEERRDNGGAFDKWEYNMRHCGAGTREAIDKVMSYVKELGCTVEISKKAATCTFYAEGTRFAVIYAYKTKDYGHFDFISDPQYDFDDERVEGPPTYTFVDIGRAVRIIPENVDLIAKCARHAYDTAKKSRAAGVGGSG